METCAHEACRCEVEAAGAFCSDHCRDMAATPGGPPHPCMCGHPACETGAS